MAQLEEIIYRRLCTDTALNKLLARYNNYPAIFFQTAPGDSQEGWQYKNQYPRIALSLDTEADAERKSNGKLEANIWCCDSGIMPEEIEPILRKNLCGVLLTPRSSETYCLVWARSDGFEIREVQSGQQTQIIGITAIFDVFAFPAQITLDPDPILAINEYTHITCGSCKIIGYDDMPEEYTPMDNAPVFYWKSGSFGIDKVSWAVSWVMGTISGHIFAPSASDRLRWLKIITQRMALDEEAIMLDGSPMFFTGLKADSTADYLRNGQIQLKVKYGILRKRQQTIEALTNKHMGL